MMNILFICVANSIRSQMAEGIARELLSGIAQVYSAGSFPSYVNPLAIQVLREINIDISHQTSKSIETLDLKEMNLIITLCKQQDCPLLPKDIKQLHWPIKDPLAFSADMEERLILFREVRDELQQKILSLKQEISK